MPFTIYRLLTLIAWPVFWGIVLWRRLNGRDESGAWRMRIGYVPRTNAPTLWCHAASVGEVQTALPLLREILEHREDLHLCLTTVTRTGAQVAREAELPRTTHAYAPFDHPAWVQRFFARLKPVAAIFIDSELWPNMLHDAHYATDDRMVLVNARLSERSARRWAKFPRVLQSLLRTFATIIPQSRTDADRLKSLGIETDDPANLKLCRPPLHSDLTQWDDTFAGRKLIVFASTHAGEEELARRIHARLRATHPDVQTVIIPRHPARASELAFDDDTIHVVGELGILGVFYRLARVAVIGNSFGTRPGGGHNPFEAAQLSCPTVFGPDMANFRDLASDLCDAGAARQVADEDELYITLDLLLSDDETRAEMVGAAQRFAGETAHALDDIAARVESCLP